MEMSKMAGGQILVVEDDDVLRSVLRKVLEEEGYVVQTSIHGQDALDYLLEARELPDLILLDLLLPTMSSWEFRTVQCQQPKFCNIPVVVLSALFDRVSRPHFVKIDAVACLRKPIDWPQLMKLIADVCRSPATQYIAINI